MDEFIAKIFSVAILIYGFSHFLQAKRWAKFLSILLQIEQDPFIIGSLTLPLGLFIVIGHNIWVLDFPVIITVCGWGMVVKSCAYLLISGCIKMITPDTEKIYATHRLALGY
jgi:hypothetical protein